MYRYSNGQVSLSDFKQPVGMKLKENNRWVKKAQTIPWPEIEKRYAALFTNRKGNARLAWQMRWTTPFDKLVVAKMGSLLSRPLSEV